MTKKITLAILCLLFCTKMLASHLYGGEITYAYTGTNNDYIITLKMYQLCGASTLGTGPFSITIASSSCGISQAYNLSNVQIDTVKEMFCTQSASCGSPFNYYIVFTATSGPISLSSCNDWKFIYNDCCLNAQIANLASPEGDGLYLESFLDNSIANNNSAVIKNYPPFYIDINKFTTNTIQNVDPDSDIVVSQFIHTQEDATSNSPYANGYDTTKLLGVGGIALINQNNQYIQLLSPAIGIYMFTMRTYEYRNSVVVGYTTRQWTTTCVADTIGVSPLPAAGTNFTYLTTPGQTQTLTLNFNDSTNIDSVFVAFTPTNNWAYTTTSAPAAGSGSGSITWTTPSSLNPADTPYFYIYVLAKSNACPTNGYAWYTILVHTALSNPNDSVWAGDANNDYTANMYDPLAIAVAYGQTGPVRTGASTAWTAQYCANWPNNFLPAYVNMKHADCNGDGVVDSNDLAAVSANYGLTHPKGNAPVANKVTGVPDLYFDLSGQVLRPGVTISIPIKFGSAALPMNNIYGLATGVELIGPINLVAAPAITYSQSWIGSTSNTLKFIKDIDNNHVDWAYARKDQSNASGNGTIATLNFTVPGPLYTGQQMKFHFANPQVIDKEGNIITAYNALDDSLTVTLGVENAASAIQYAEIVPNPSKSQAELQMFVAQAGNINIKITDLLGRTAWQQTIGLGTGNQNIVLPNTNIIPGMYMIRLHGEGWQYSKTLKWIKE